MTTTLPKPLTKSILLTCDLTPLMKSIYDTIFNYLTDECSAYWKRWEQDSIELENLVKEGVDEVDLRREDERSPNGDSLLDYIEFTIRINTLFSDLSDELIDTVGLFIIDNVDQLEILKCTKRILFDMHGRVMTMVTYDYIDPDHPDTPLTLFEIPNFELGESIRTLDDAINIYGLKVMICVTIETIIEKLKEGTSKPKSARNI